MIQHSLAIRIIEDFPDTFLLFLFCTDCLTIFASEYQVGNFSKILIGATTQ